MARDVHRNNDKKALLKGPDRVQRAFNWLFFGVELVAVTGLLAGVGRHCSSRAYCESCGKWMKSETLKLPPGQGATVWDSLQRGDFAAVQQHLAGTSRQGSISGSLTIEHCPHCPAENRSNTVYLTVNDIPVPGTPDPIAAKVGSMFKPKHTSACARTRATLNCTPRKSRRSPRASPVSRAPLRPIPISLPRCIPRREIDRAVEVQADEWTDRVARVEAVEASDAGTILTRKNAIIQTIIGSRDGSRRLSPGSCPAGVISMLDHEPPDWVSGTALVWMFGCMFLNLGWLLFFAHYPTSRFMLRQTRHAFELRPNPAVNMNDPDLFFVDIIPRINWGKQMMENATDIGFLQLDKTRRELRFEGDRERYWIPAESILEIKHEFWAESVQHQLQKAPSLNHVIVVRAMTASGPWETWFYSRQYKFRPLTEKRRLADALELNPRSANWCSRRVDLMGKLAISRKGRSVRPAGIFPSASATALTRQSHEYPML